MKSFLVFMEIRHVSQHALPAKFLKDVSVRIIQVSRG